MAQPTPDVAHETIGEAKDRGGNGAGRHQVGGEDKKGDGHEGKRVDAVEKALRHGQKRQLAFYQECNQTRSAHDKGKRHADCHTREKNDPKRNGHRITSSSISASRLSGTSKLPSI